MTKQRIVLFASGSGSNAEKIIEHFQHHPLAEVVLVLSNNTTALVHQRAQKFNVPSDTFDRNSFYQTEEVLQKIKAVKADWIILAGFMWLVPSYLTKAFPNRIINIHPALLPKFGGKGMYGQHVHKAVIEAGEKESGITIHYVNEHYDEGNIIFQTSYKLDTAETPESLAEKIHQLEHENYPKVIEELVRNSS